jgi:hypothetical protein
MAPSLNRCLILLNIAVNLTRYSNSALYRRFNLVRGERNSVHVDYLPIVVVFLLSIINNIASKDATRLCFSIFTIEETYPDCKKKNTVI